MTKKYEFALRYGGNGEILEVFACETKAGDGILEITKDELFMLCNENCHKAFYVCEGKLARKKQEEIENIKNEERILDEISSLEEEIEKLSYSQGCRDIPVMLANEKTTEAYREAVGYFDKKECRKKTLKERITDLRKNL